MSASVSSITVSVFNPRKSIFRSPRSLSGPIGYWLMTSLPFGIFFYSRLQGDIQLVRNHLRDAIGVAIAQPHHPANIAHHALCFEFAKSDDLRDAPLTIFLPHVFEDFAAAGLTKIDIDIRRRNAVRI